LMLLTNGLKPLEFRGQCYSSVMLAIVVKRDRSRHECRTLPRTVRNRSKNWKRYSG
jgi:hypothetical protein